MCTGEKLSWVQAARGHGGPREGSRGLRQEGEGRAGPWEEEAVLQGPVSPSHGGRRHLTWRPLDVAWGSLNLPTSVSLLLQGWLWGAEAETAVQELCGLICAELRKPRAGACRLGLKLSSPERR